MPGLPRGSDTTLLRPLSGSDAGLSFGPIRHVVGNRSAEGTAANPTVVYLPPDRRSHRGGGGGRRLNGTLLMHYDCGTCASHTGEVHGATL
jgi:hypothetical protein